MDLKDKVFFRFDEQVILTFLMGIFLLYSGIEISKRAGLCEVKIDKRIDINRADLFTLEALPGIGPKLAGRIIDYRIEEGGFKSTEEITEVKGIGRKKFERLSNLIIVEESTDYSDYLQRSEIRCQRAEIKNLLNLSSVFCLLSSVFCLLSSVFCPLSSVV